MLENAFTLILNMSVTASIATILIVFLRMLSRSRFPKAFVYALWAIVLVRLLVPFSIPSVFSIFNTIHLENMVSQDSQYHQPDNSFPGITQYGSMSVEKTGNALQGGMSSSYPSPDPTASVDPVQVRIFIFSCIWLLIAAGLLSFGIYVYLRALHRLDEAVLYKNDNLVDRCRHMVNLKRKVPVYISDRIQTPVVCGLLKPRVILPHKIIEDCDEQELKYIITHELVHIKRFDYMLKPLAVLALCLHWFNPVIWLAYILSRKDMEMACDERVITVFDTDIRSEYAQSLVKLAVKQNGIHNGVLPAFGESNIKSRIKGIMKFKRTGLLMGVASIIILISVGAVLLTNGQYKDNNGKSRGMGAGDNAGSRFAIYLVKETNTITAIEKGIGNVELEGNPIISGKDIKSYNWSDHTIEFNEEIYGRIPKVPMSGLPFVVVADGERIYTGAFWTSFSSVSTDLPVIDVLIKPFKIVMGYPGKPDNASDQRNDMRIYKVLKETGKLSLKPDAALADKKTERAPPSNSKRLWEKDGWTYYLAQIPRGGVIPLDNYVGRLYRQNSEGITESLDELVAYENNNATILPANDRIVFIGFAGTGVMDFKTFTMVSIREDGSDRKTFNTNFNTARQLCYDKGYLYYEGWTNDGAFPRPVCRIDTGFKRNIKMADIDGSLITVYDGYAYYLSDSIKRLKLDWASKPEIWDKAAIGKKIISVRKIADNEYDVVYDENKKPYVLRLPGERRTAFNVIQKYFDAFGNADYESMKALATEYHNKNLVHDGDVWGMKWARIKEMELVEPPGFLRLKSPESTLVYFVSVEMETVKTSAQYPSTRTSFYVTLVKDAGGNWRIDKYSTG